MLACNQRSSHIMRSSVSNQLICSCMAGENKRGVVLFMCGNTLHFCSGSISIYLILHTTMRGLKVFTKTQEPRFCHLMRIFEKHLFPGAILEVHKISKTMEKSHYGIWGTSESAVWRALLVASESSFTCLQFETHNHKLLGKINWSIFNQRHKYIHVNPERELFLKKHISIIISCRQGLVHKKFNLKSIDDGIGQLCDERKIWNDGMCWTFLCSSLLSFYQISIGPYW